MATKRKMKKRKSRDSSEEEEESDIIDFKVLKRNGAMKHDFERLCTSDQYEHPDMIEKLDPKDFNLELFERNGLIKPLLFHCKPEELGMKMPNPETFTADDVLKMVGEKREVEVVVVQDQSSRLIPLSSMVDYWKHPEGRDLTNMLSLEFSLDRLRDHVSGPAIVNDIDWVNNYFPDELFTRSVSFGRKSTFSFHTNYPAVQRYCLMSTPQCYTDFHLDFGGTSVWYHVLKGEKVFFLVEPDLQNMKMYDEWQRNYDSSVWFGDIISKCARMVLKEGDTAILPSGWLHSVYTPVKSLVFGGNFLHSYSAAMQCKVHNLEQKLRIGVRYRFPEFEPLNFYVIAKIVEECTGRKYVMPIYRNTDLEYVGKEWIAQGGHRVPITWDYYRNKMKQIRLAKQQQQQPITVEIPKDDPMAFYCCIKRGVKARGKSNHHKNAINIEPPIVFNQDKLDRISAHLLVQYEAMLNYMFCKKFVDLPEYITRPSSLLYCFQTILRERRKQLTDKGETLPAPPDIYVPPEISEENPEGEEPSIVMENEEPSAVAVPGSPCSSRSEELGGFDDNSFMESVIEEKPSCSTTEASNMDISAEPADIENGDNFNQPVKEECDSNGKTKREKNVENEENVDVKETDDIQDGENIESSEHRDEGSVNIEKKELETDSSEKSPKKKNDKSHKTPKSKIKKTQKTPERKRKERTSFDEALHGTPKAKKKCNPKKDKPEFVGGIPVAPIQTGPAIPNAYNYDPMQEITKLGTGQLQSSYRKSQFNIAPPKQVKIYKLEHKTSTETDHPDDDGYSNRPLVSPTVKAPARKSFIPDLNIKTTPTKLPSALYSPTAPRTETERRFSTGSAEKPTDISIRDRTISFDSGSSSILSMLNSPEAISNPCISSTFGSSNRGSSSIVSSSKTAESKLHTVDHFLIHAPLLVQKLNTVNQK